MRSLSLLVPALCASFAAAVQPIEVEGRYFVNSVTRARFQMIGVDYQPGAQSGYDPASEKDPLSDGDVCLRDAALMQRLGVNTVRVYNLDPTLDHDLCVSIFNRVGIYLLLDVNSPLGGESLDRSRPAESYHGGYLRRAFGIVEAFKDYPNTLGFFGGNEVINEDSHEDAPPYIRAVQRDLKNYIANHCDRAIPVGYSAADVRELLDTTWSYLQCSIEGEENDRSRADFFGLNSYSWCGDEATYESSEYNILVEKFADSSVPVFFSEYGCNEVRPRVFNEVQAVYSEQMTPVMSGGLIYEYSQEEADYGLVDIDADGSIKLREDYENLQQQFGELDIARLSAAPDDKSGANVRPPTCSEDGVPAHSNFNVTFEIPSPPEDVEEDIENGIPDANNGELVDVSETEVKQSVEDSQGKPIENLAITLLDDDESNVPTPVEPGSSPTETGAAAPALHAGCGHRALAVAATLLLSLAASTLL